MSIGEQSFFKGVMLWKNDQSGLSFENKRISTRVDKENLNAFFFAFSESKELLSSLAKEFAKFNIESEIIPLSKYTKGKTGYVLETQRHEDFTQVYETWYDGAGK